MRLFNFSQTVEYEESISEKYSRWNHDSILFRVNKGNGKLSTKYGRDLSGETHGFLLLDNKPLINSYGDELYCPTCAKVLSIGLGRENVDQALIDTVKYSQETIELEDTFENMKPLLSILENGYYLLTRMELMPTDGEGNFYWNLSRSKKTYMASSDIYYKYHVSSGTPKFILPSQSMDCFNKERVDYYIDQIRSGKNMTGLAYYYDGFMCTLLDGHHRAAAAYIENKTIECVTIIKVNGYGFDTNGRLDKIYAGGEAYELSMLKKPQRVCKYLMKLFKSRSSQLSVKEVERLLVSSRSEMKVECPIDIEAGKKNYPDYLSIAFANLAGNVSKEHIDEVMIKRDEDAEFELEMILKKLILDEPIRAFELSKEIIEDDNWKSLWEDAIMYLATIDSVDVEDFFVQFLIDHDYDPKDKCRKIVDTYLNNR